MTSILKKRSLFYLFGLVYNTTIIAAGSICLSFIMLALAGMVVYAGQFLVFVGIYGWIKEGGRLPLGLFLLGLGACLFVQLMFFLASQTAIILPMLAGTISFSCLTVVLGSILPLVLGLVIGYFLVTDLLIGVSHGSLDFYHYHLHQYGIAGAFASPFIYLFERMRSFLFSSESLDCYLSGIKKRTLIADHVDVISDDSRLITTNNKVKLRFLQRVRQKK